MVIRVLQDVSTLRDDEVFILTSDVADIAGSCRLQYWGIGANGPVLLRFPSHTPLFFLPRSVSVHLSAHTHRRSLDLLSFDGNPVDGLYFSDLSTYWDTRRRLEDEGIQTWESDVRPEDRFLMERFIAGSARVSGECQPDGGLWVFNNPRLAPSQWRPELTTLSLDIETGRNGEIYSVAVYAMGSGEPLSRVAVLDPKAPVGGRTEVLDAGPETYVRLPEEIDLLRFFIEAVHDIDPDLIIGWHVIGFDLSFLNDKGRQLGLPLRIGRGHAPLKIVQKKGALPIADLEGRLVIDGPPTLRGTFHHFSDWRLDTVAHELLGRNKDIEGEGTDKVEEIERRFREDKGALARYNLQDAVLTADIFSETAILEQMLTRSLITGLPLNQVHRSVAAFDHFFLPRLHRRGYVAPSKNSVSAESSSPGALVFAGESGLFTDVAVLDFKSLYPTIMRTFHIDPYSFLMAKDDPLDTPVGIHFSRSQHILPVYLKELMERRAAAHSDEDDTLAFAVKILMNSMYGVMASPACRFYRLELPTAITGIGKWVLESTSKLLRSWDYQVLYGDTDSVFVRFKDGERQNPDASGRQLASRVDEWFRSTIQNQYAVVSQLELEYEKRYEKFFLPVMRSGNRAAVKRYVGLLPDGKVEIKGMEFVRSDATELARDFQHELYQRYFAGEDLKIWIREMVSRLRSGEFDGKLVYRRQLRRSVRDYKSPPPHVKAAKLLDPDGSRDIRSVEYIITPTGPMPLELFSGEIDYNHYIEKQLRSLANDVLLMENESFDSVIGGQQLELF